MLERLIHFIKYHNAFTVAIVLLLLGSSVFAASPDAREVVADAVVESVEEVVSIDNTYITSVDLSQFVPRVQITEVSEDEEHYYVSYLLTSIGLVDHVWQDIQKEISMTVAKIQLGESDLGLHVTEELTEVIDRELSLLRETQEIEKGRGTTQKTVATAYSGLVGKFLDPKQEVIPGYQPVKPPPPPPPPPSPTPKNNQTQSSGSDGSTNNSGSSGNNTANGDTEPPTITILGNNPAQVALGNGYSDLGAAITDNVNKNLGYSVTGVGEIDTKIVGEYTVVYTAEDQAGNRTIAERTVIVFDPNQEPAEEVDETEEETGQSSTTTPSETTPKEDITQDSSTEESPEPEPEPTPDTTAPVITLIGPATIELEAGGDYNEQGVAATDDTDGDITANVQTSGSVDTTVAGSYTVTYSVSDSAGNATQETRTVVVTATPEPEPEQTEESVSTTTEPTS